MNIVSAFENNEKIDTSDEALESLFPVISAGVLDMLI